MHYRLAQPYSTSAGYGVTMRISDDARKCVVYIGYGDPLEPEAIDPEGTGFFVSSSDPGMSYLVTALHVADVIKDNEPFHIRYNNKVDGKGESVLYEDGVQWYTHPEYPDEIIDVAVAQVDPPEWADCLHFPLSSFLSDEKIESKKIGAGDLAYVVGVYALLKGAKRNLPLVHTGNIALMAGDEPIPMGDWRSGKEGETIYVNGYLVGAHTLPRISGSPVFVRKTVMIQPHTPSSILLSDVNTLAAEIESADAHAEVIMGYGSLWLLGLWQGGWGADPREFLALPSNEELDVPIGMGVTVPATKIIDVINRPEFEEMRKKKRKEELDGRQAATPQTLVEDVSVAPAMDTLVVKPQSKSKEVDEAGQEGDSLLKKMLDTPPKPHPK